MTCKIFLLLVTGSVLLLACGGGAGTGSTTGVSQSLSGNGSLVGGSGLLPIPEDIFDLPNTLPDSFATAACPTTAAKPVVRDLSIRLSAGGSARQGTFQGTGAIFLTQNSSQPVTLGLDVRSIGNQAYSLSSLGHSPIYDRVTIGKVYDGNGQLLATPDVVFGEMVPRLSFVANAGPAYQTLLTALIPGFAGDNFNIGLPAEGLEGNFTPGVYVVAVVFETAESIICTQSSMVFVVE